MLGVLRHDRDELDDVGHVWLHDRQVRGGHRAVTLQALEDKSNIVQDTEKWIYPRYRKVDISKVQKSGYIQDKEKWLYQRYRKVPMSCQRAAVPG